MKAREYDAKGAEVRIVGVDYSYENVLADMKRLDPMSVRREAWTHVQTTEPSGLTTNETGNRRLRIEMKNAPFPVEVYCVESQHKDSGLWLVYASMHVRDRDGDRFIDVHTKRQCFVMRGANDLELKEHLLGFIRTLLHEMATHEIDEALHFEGERIFDPHEGERPFGVPIVPLEVKLRRLEERRAPGSRELHGVTWTASPIVGKFPSPSMVVIDDPFEPAREAERMALRDAIARSGLPRLDFTGKPWHLVVADEHPARALSKYTEKGKAIHEAALTALEDAERLAKTLGAPKPAKNPQPKHTPRSGFTPKFR